MTITVADVNNKVTAIKAAIGRCKVAISNDNSNVKSCDDGLSSIKNKIDGMVQDAAANPDPNPNPSSAGE